MVARGEADARAAEIGQVRARVGALEQHQIDIERARDQAGAHAEAAVRDRDALARELEIARQGASAEQNEMVARVQALDAECTNLRRSLQEAEARLEAANSDRAAMAAELEVIRQTASSVEAEAHAWREQVREAAEARMRALEVELMQRDLELQERDVELSALLSGTAVEPDSTSDNRPSEVIPTQAAPRNGPAVSRSGPLYPNQPLRSASRHAFQEEIEVQIDGGAATLVDLSLTGAQVIAPMALKPNRMVRVLLPFEESVIACKGKIVWARLEPPAPGAAVRYRAGVFFSSADEAGLEGFLALYTTGRRAS